MAKLGDRAQRHEVGPGDSTALTKALRAEAEVKGGSAGAAASGMLGAGENAGIWENSITERPGSSKAKRRDVMTACRSSGGEDKRRLAGSLGGECLRSSAREKAVLRDFDRDRRIS